MSWNNDISIPDDPEIRQSSENRQLYLLTSPRVFLLHKFNKAIPKKYRSELIGGWLNSRDLLHKDDPPIAIAQRT